MSFQSEPLIEVIQKYNTVASRDHWIRLSMLFQNKSVAYYILIYNYFDINFLILLFYVTVQSMKFSWKNIEIWRSWNFEFFLGGHFDFFFNKEAQNWDVVEKNQNGPPKKPIFQLRQFSIFDHENFMDWFLG